MKRFIIISLLAAITAPALACMWVETHNYYLFSVYNRQEFKERVDKISRDNWKALADEPDLDREDFLLAATPGKILYDPLAKGARKVLAETCSITNEAAAEEAATVISYRPGRTPNGRILHDGLLFGNQHQPDAILLRHFEKAGIGRIGFFEIFERKNRHFRQN